MQHDVSADESEASAPNAERQPDDRAERRVVTPAELGTMMVHFDRGEIARANVWRQRLDATFNWAVLATGTTLSFAYGNVAAPHVVT